ncbi:hypothetical protein HYW46_00025 [Candidatus Daviesbacteria bacterium]|nr:hypothetical protein [Candidatus Daviesbacteria bacterium]
MPKIILISLAVILAAFLGYQNFNSSSSIDKDTVISGDYKIGKDKTIVVRNGSKVVVKGKTEIAGSLRCENGAIKLETQGDLKVTGAIVCNRDKGDKKPSGDEQGINIIAKGDFDFEKDSVLASNAHIQIVESEDLLLQTQEDFKNAFNETAQDSGEGFRIGPLFNNIPKQTTFDNLPQLQITPQTDTNLPAVSLIKTVQADNSKRGAFRGKIGQSWGNPNDKLPGWVDLKDIPRYLDYLLFWVNMPNRTLELYDSVIFTPNGHDAKDILGGCDINAPDAEKIKDENDDTDAVKKNAMRMRARAKVIKVKNFHLFLGDGGKGGDAVTDKNCRPGKAIAGHGGNAANFKWTAQENIDIVGSFFIYPGKGGDGGKAIAYGDKGDPGCPGKTGFNATAKGGWGAPNHRVLSATGDVGGLQNIYIDQMVGGNGGDAEVYPGEGGDADKCDCKGGKPGTGYATPGKGGDVSLKYPPGVQRGVGVKDVKGEDGKAVGQKGLLGKDGSACGGDKSVTAKPSPSPKKVDTTSQNFGDQNPGQASIEVLVINGQNFPSKQFRVASPDECGALHYHADLEVSSVDLKTHMNDPNPSGCGFGKVAEIVKKTISISQEQAYVWQ